MSETTFTISGMSCGGCVNSLTRVLKSVPGIEPIKIEVGKARLRLDERATSQTVKEAVSRAGFEVTASVIMTPLDWAIAASAIVLIAFVNWFFLGSKGTAVVATAAAPGGGRRHRPRRGRLFAVNRRGAAGARVRLTFDRREDNPARTKSSFRTSGSKPLAAYATTSLEFTATPGRHEFSCGMGMLHGTIIGK